MLPGCGIASMARIFLPGQFLSSSKGP